MDKRLKKYIKSICRIYKVRLLLRKGGGGGYWAGEIELGTSGSTSDIISTFCHELGHYKNDIEGKYPIYHREDSCKTIRRIGIGRYTTYALKAEIYTEKEGKKLAKIWFPNYKYKVTYKNDAYSKGFLDGFYF